MKRWLAGVGAVVVAAIVAWWVWGSSASTSAPSEVQVAPRRAGDGYLPARVESKWTQPLAARGERTLRGLVTKGGKPVGGAVVTALDAHGEDVLSDRPCQCDNHCGLKLVQCGCAEAAGQLVELAVARTGEAQPLARATTGADGRFELAGLPEAGAVALWADAPDGIAFLAEVTAPTPEPELALEDGHFIHGVVRSGDREPVAGALVTAIFAAQSRFFDGTSDADGGFRLGPLPQGRYAVVGARDGVLPDHAQTDVPARREKALELTLDQPRALDGTVTAGGAPAPGVAVTLEGMHRKRTVTTDATGHFRFERLRAGPYELAALGPQGRGDTSTTVEQQGDRSGVAIELQRGLDVEGVVVDDQGAPVADARLWASSGERAVRATSGKDGRFVIASVPAGSLELSAEKKGHVRAEQQVTAGTPVRLTLTRAVELSGRVVDPDGHAVLEFSVEAQSADGGWADGESRRQDGGFVLEVAPGRYTLEVSALGFNAAKVPVTAPAVGLEVRLSAGARIRGLVVTAPGQPRAGWLPTAVSESAPKERSPEAWTDGMVPGKPSDDAGVFEIGGLEPGRYVVSVYQRPSEPTADEASAGVIGFAPPAAEHVDVPASGVVDVTLRAKPGVAVSGVVLKGRGDPAAGARVLAEPTRTSGGERGADRSPIFAVADARGRFRFEGLTGESLTLLAFDGSRRAAPTRSPPVSVKPPSSDVVLRLPLATTVSGRVLGDDGQPVKHFQLNHRPIDSPDGRFETPSYEGRAHLVIDAPGYAQFGHNFVARPGPNDVGDLRLDRGRVLEGRVVDALTRRPIAGALVDVGDLDPQTGALPVDFVLSQRAGAVKTDSSGAFRIEHLDPRVGGLFATAQGYAPYATLLDKRSSIELALTPGGRVSALVKDGADRPLVAEMVLATGPRGEHARLRLEEGGRYVAQGLAPGRWLVRASLRGLYAPPEPATVKSGETAQVTLRPAAQLTELELAGEQVEGAVLSGHVSVEQAFDSRRDQDWVTVVDGRAKVPPGPWTLVLTRGGLGEAVAVVPLQVGSTSPQRVDLSGVSWRERPAPLP